MWPALTADCKVEVEQPSTFHWEGYPQRKGCRNGGEVSEVVWVNVLNIVELLQRTLECTSIIGVE